MKVNPAVLAFWRRVLAKLAERSSVASYLTLLVTAFARHFQGDVALWASLISGTATILLFVLSDAQVRYWLTGEKPAPIAPTVPQPFDSDKPDKG
jgi:hypothetical protein